jgi:hypothetical protein
MSKQTSHVTFKGNMGKVSYFKRKGVDSARVKTGVSREKFLTAPTMERVRENVREFNALSRTVKSFRLALAQVKKFQDGTLANRLSTVFNLIKKRSDGARGRRPVLISANRSLLKDLEFNAQKSLQEIFTPTPAATHTAARNSASVTFQAFNPGEMVQAPATATHFRLVHLLGIVSDTIYDEESKTYKPADTALNGLHHTTTSEYVPLSGGTLDISLETVLPGAPVLNDNVSAIQALGILFYEKVGTEYYWLAKDKAMKVINVF